MHIRAGELAQCYGKRVITFPLLVLGLSSTDHMYNVPLIQRNTHVHGSAYRETDEANDTK